MRAIFIVLLVANLAFFGYQYFFAEVNRASVAPEKKEGAAPLGGLQLLSEKKDGAALPAKQRPVAAGQSNVESEAQKQSSDFCTMLGPYGQLLQAEYAVERLGSLGVAARIAPVEIKEGESYWVYLKPEVSEKEALRRLYELQKKNIESHIIAKGELTNGISFGRFADYAAADAKSTEIKSQGYEVEIKMLPKMIQETWVVVDAGFAEKIDETVWADLLTKDSGLEKRQNFCLGVASE
ncbi:MAG TPA: hypothetical protein VLC79_03755 [Cellvibrio sp.]|nr:hypothetical protein [Cellvibrio sp.]